MPRFVILEHDHPYRHWDFMLENGDMLRTWRLTEPLRCGSAVSAEKSFDHRLAYLDYQGPVSGNRGHVQRWDAGVFTAQIDEPDRVVVQLEGARIRGTATLARADTGSWYVKWCDKTS